MGKNTHSFVFLCFHDQNQCEKGKTGINYPSEVNVLENIIYETITKMVFLSEKKKKSLDYSFRF